MLNLVKPKGLFSRIHLNLIIGNLISKLDANFQGFIGTRHTFHIFSCENSLHKPNQRQSYQSEHFTNCFLLAEWKYFSSDVKCLIMFC